MPPWFWICETRCQLSRCQFTPVNLGFGALQYSARRHLDQLDEVGVGDICEAYQRLPELAPLKFDLRLLAF